MDVPLLSSNRDSFLDLEEVTSRSESYVEHHNFPSSQQHSTSGSFSISKKYLHLFPPNHLKNLAALRWNDCHFEGKENVIAVFDTDYESLESFYKEMVIGFQKLIGVVIFLILFIILLDVKRIMKYRQLGYTIPEEMIFFDFLHVVLHVVYIILLLFLMRRIKRNEKIELIRHIAITTEGVYIETNQSYAGLIRRKKNISVTKIPYDDIISCKYDHVLYGHRWECGKIEKTLQLKMRGICNQRAIEGIIHGDVMVQMIIWLRDNKSEVKLFAIIQSYPATLHEKDVTSRCSKEIPLIHRFVEKEYSSIVFSTSCQVSLVQVLWITFIIIACSPYYDIEVCHKFALPCRIEMFFKHIGSIALILPYSILFARSCRIEIIIVPRRKSFFGMNKGTI